MNAGDRIYQGGRDINPMEHRFVGGEADVGAANLVPAFWSNFVYESSTVQARQMTTWAARNALGVGDIVAVSRGNTNRAILVEIDRINVTGTYNNSSGITPATYRVDFVKIADDEPCIGGDSGSPVYASGTAEGAVIACAFSDIAWVPITGQMGIGGFSGRLVTPPPY